MAQAAPTTAGEHCFLCARGTAVPLANTVSCSPAVVSAAGSLLPLANKKTAFASGTAVPLAQRKKCSPAVACAFPLARVAPFLSSLSPHTRPSLSFLSSLSLFLYHHPRNQLAREAAASQAFLRERPLLLRAQAIPRCTGLRRRPSYSASPLCLRVRRRARDRQPRSRLRPRAPPHPLHTSHRASPPTPAAKLWSEIGRAHV